MKNKKILIPIIFGVIIVITVIFVIFTGNNKPSSLEDEIYSYAKDLENKYGDISVDIAYAYCNGDEQRILICYYGTGSNYDKYGDTYIMYSTSKNGDVEITDPHEDRSDLSSSFLNVVYATWIEEYHEYKDSEQIITYDEFKEFKEGCIDENFFESVNDKLQ